jgi:hypothetical protein
MYSSTRISLFNDTKLFSKNMCFFIHHLAPGNSCIVIRSFISSSNIFSELIHVYLHNAKQIHGESWKEFFDGFFQHEWRARVNEAKK